MLPLDGYHHFDGQAGLKNSELLQEVAVGKLALPRGRQEYRSELAQAKGDDGRGGLMAIEGGSPRYCS